MGIIIKYLIKSITEKKFRTFLVIFAIALAGSLFFASTSLSDSLVSLYTKQIYQMIGNSEIMIYANQYSPSVFVSTVPASNLAAETEYIIPTLSDVAYYKTDAYSSDTLSLTGISLEDYAKFNELSLKKRIKDAPFIDYSIIISNQTAEKYGVDVGDMLELTIEGGKRKFTIYGISNPVGFFGSETNSIQALVPFHTLSVFQNAGDRPNAIYIRSNDSVDYKALITKLQEAYPKYTVREPFDAEALAQSIDSLAMPLMFMTILVTFMSIFIVNSSFKVITLEKLPHVGTFRSIGASKSIMNRVLFGESLCYGVIGGFVSCLLGIGVLRILVQFISSQSFDGRSTITLIISPSKLITTFLLCLIVSLISSMAPIFRIAKIPVKEIVLGNITKLKKNKTIKYIIWIILLILGIVLPVRLPRDLYLITSSVGMILSIAGIIQLLPLIIKLTSYIAEFIFSRLFGNIGLLAVKNIRGNKSMLNSISLITIGISILLMINTLSTDINIEILGFYEKTWKFDILADAYEADKRFVSALRAEDGIDKIAGSYSANRITVKELDTQISTLMSAPNAAFDNFMNFDLQYSTPEILDKLNTGRYIIPSVTLEKRYDLKIGDKVTLELKGGDRTYEIIDFSDCLLNMGSFAVIGEDYIKLDHQMTTFTDLYIKTNTDPNELVTRLSTKYADRYLWARTVEEMKIEESEGTAQFMLIFLAFSFLAIIIGIIGIINNLLISFIERKQSIAVLRSVGLSKPQTICMIFLEAIYSSFLGGLIGIFTGWLVLLNLPPLLEAMDLSMPIYMITNTLWIYVAASMIITVIASITPALRSSKLNIIEAIKFE